MAPLFYFMTCRYFLSSYISDDVGIVKQFSLFAKKQSLLVTVWCSPYIETGSGLGASFGQTVKILRPEYITIM